MIDKKGDFKVDGFYKRGSFGPTRMNNLPKFEPVHYEGRITGKLMELKITPSGASDVIGEYTLEQGKPAGSIGVFKYSIFPSEKTFHAQR